MWHYEPTQQVVLFGNGPPSPRGFLSCSPLSPAPPIISKCPQHSRPNPAAHPAAPPAAPATAPCPRVRTTPRRAGPCCGSEPDKRGEKWHENTWGTGLVVVGVPGSAHRKAFQAGQMAPEYLSSSCSARISTSAPWSSRSSAVCRGVGVPGCERPRTGRTHFQAGQRTHLDVAVARGVVQGGLGKNVLGVDVRALGQQQPSRVKVPLPPPPPGH